MNILTPNLLQLSNLKAELDQFRPMDNAKIQQA